MLDLISAFCAAFMCLGSIYKLTWLHAIYNTAERIGLGLIAGPSLLLMLSLLEGPDSPFRMWAFTIFMAGNLVYFAGRLTREIKHARNNNLMRERSRQHFERKEAR